MTIFQKIDETDEFKRDYRRLEKRFKTLRADFDVFIATQLNLFHKQKQDNGGVWRISETGCEYPLFYRAKKFACASLYGTGCKSGMRVVYAYWEKEDRIEFIEMFHKNEQPELTEKRLRSYVKSRCS